MQQKVHPERSRRIPTRLSKGQKKFLEELENG